MWSRVRLDLAGREVIGTVVEDRGSLGGEGKQLFRVQLDWVDVAEPVELEIPATELEALALPADKKASLTNLLRTGSKRNRDILKAALDRFGSDLRHVSHGLWPDHLQVDGRNVPTNHCAAVLDELANLGFVVKRPSGIYVSTSWLMEYIDQAAERGKLDATGS